MFKCAYAIINKESSMCVQIIRTNNLNWILDNASDYSMIIDLTHASEYLEKYFYDNQWWVREWVYEEALDEEGNTYQQRTEEYTDHPWSIDN